MQSNLVKDNRDDYIPDEVASVQNETVWDWLFITEKKHNAHNLPPSQMFQLLQNKKVSELEKITKFLEKLLGQKEKMTVLE